MSGLNKAIIKYLDFKSGNTYTEEFKILKNIGLIDMENKEIDECVVKYAKTPIGLTYIDIINIEIKN